MYVLGHNILVFAGTGVSLAVCAFAVWKGDAAVRWAAVTLACTDLLSFSDPFLPGVGVASLMLTRGLVSAVIYLLLAVRFANLWIGGAMLLQAVQFSLDSYYFVTERPLDHLHAWINNSAEWGIVLCVFVGALLSIFRRVATAREARELEVLRQQRTSPAA